MWRFVFHRWNRRCEYSSRDLCFMTGWDLCFMTGWDLCFHDWLRFVFHDWLRFVFHDWLRFVFHDWLRFMFHDWLRFVFHDRPRFVWSVKSCVTVNSLKMACLKYFWNSLIDDFWDVRAHVYDLMINVNTVRLSYIEHSNIGWYLWMRCDYYVYFTTTGTCKINYALETV